MNKQNTTYTAYVGIDRADKKHDFCIRSAHESDSSKTFGVIPHNPAKIEEWVLSLQEKYGGKMAFAMELAAGPIVYALQKYDFIDIYPIAPTTLAKYREAFSPSRAKDDPTDAELALDLILRHPERFKMLKPQSTEMRSLIALVEQRRKLVQDKVRVTNRIRSTLKQYYPQSLEVFDRIDTFTFCDFIERWPTLDNVKRARQSTITSFFKDHSIRRKDLIDKRLELINSSMPLTKDKAVIATNSLQALVHIDLLRTILRSIKKYDETISELAPQHADYALFESLPGAGPSLAPRLLAAFGEQRERFTSAAELQQYAGISPVTERSGQKHWVHWRWHCPTFLRQTFVEWSAQTINKSFWAGAYYRQQRDKGASYNAAVRSLAFKWIRILFACWKTNRPYNESQYLSALQRRGSPLIANLGTVENA